MHPNDATYIWVYLDSYDKCGNLISQDLLYQGYIGKNTDEYLKATKSEYVTGNTYTSPSYQGTGNRGTFFAKYSATFDIDTATRVTYSQYHTNGGNHYLAGNTTMTLNYITFNFYNSAGDLIDSVQKDGVGNGTVLFPAGTKKLIINGQAGDSISTNAACSGYHTFELQ